MTVKAILLASVLIAASHAANAAPKWAVDVPMTVCDGFPCITAQLGSNEPGTVLIDTGNVVSIVDNAQAAAIGFSDKPGPDGNVHAAHTTAQIGDLKLEDVPAYATDLKGAIIKGEMPHADATLAYSAFKDRAVQMDFIHHRFRVSPPNPAKSECRDDCAALHLITFGRKGPPIVVADGFAVNGKTVTAQIDSVWSGSLLIYTASITKLGLSDAATVKTSERFPFTDGGVNELKGNARDIGFAGKVLTRNAALYFPTPGVHEPDALFDGTVGIALFRDRIVTLDFHNMTMRLADG
jgi:hypothetical protein